MNPFSNREAQRAEAARRVYDATKVPPRPTAVTALYSVRDGVGQVMVTTWSNGDVELAERERPWDTWGPPRLLTLVRVDP